MAPRLRASTRDKTENLLRCSRQRAKDAVKLRTPKKLKKPHRYISPPENPAKQKIVKLNKSIDFICTIQRRQSEKKFFKKSGLRSEIKNHSTSSSKNPIHEDNKKQNLEFNEGAVVWAKLIGSPWWPAIIIDEKLCKMERPSVSEKWVFWFGEYTVSKLPVSSIQEFKTCFEKQFKPNRQGSYINAIVEACKECARKCGENIQEWNKEECISWAKNGFQNLHLPFQDSTEANMQITDSSLPQFITNQLIKIAEKNSQKGTSRCPYPTPDSEFYISRRAENLHELYNGLRIIEEICLACYSLKNEDKDIYKHPLFNGGICSECRERIKVTFFTFEDAGKHIYCTVCGSYSNKHNICDKIDCGRLYCHYCLEAFGRRLENWQCFLCSDFLEENTLLRKRELWQLNVLKLYDETEYCETEYLPLSGFPKKKLRVLSLFDGIATGLFALEKLGIDVEAYYACEVDFDAIHVGKWNFKEKVSYLGDVTDVTKENLQDIGPIDLLIGGSPCKDLSFVNPRRKGLYDITGSGYLVFEFFRIKELLEEIQKSHIFFLFENVTHMPPKYVQQISRCFRCSPVMIDAQFFSAAHRARLFWGNIPGLRTLMMPRNSPNLQEKIVQGFGRIATREKLLTITTNSNSLRRDSYGPTPVKMDDDDVLPWVTELEDIFGFPHHYTDTGGISLMKRHQLLGRAWSVDVIFNILKPLCSFYALKTSNSSQNSL